MALREAACLTFTSMLQEADQVLADLRACKGVAVTGPDDIDQPVLCEVEHLRITLRINRVVSWIAVEGDIRAGRCRLADVALTLHALFDCAALQEEIDGLPERLRSLSARSIDLFERASRLRSGA